MIFRLISVSCLERGDGGGGNLQRYIGAQCLGKSFWHTTTF
jgi:hypothetical protein